jgi:hypothetical protein
LRVEVEKVSAVLSLDEPGRKPAKWIDISVEGPLCSIYQKRISEGKEDY